MTRASKRKLRILFSHYGIKDGDGFGRTFMLARELAGLGHEVTLLTSQRNGFTFPLSREWRDEVEIVSFPDVVPKSMRKGGLGPLNIVLKSAYALTRPFDIVHSDSGHRPSAGVPCTIHRFFRDSVYVSEWWDYFGKGGLQDGQPWWYRATLGLYDTWAEVHNKKIADGVITLSEFTKQRARQAGVPEERILVLHGGADTKTIQYIADTRNRSKFGLPDDTFTVGFVGINEGELEDLVPFIQATGLLRANHKINWFSTGGRLSPEVRTKAGIGDEYHEFGWIAYSQFSDLLSCADAFVMLLKDNLISRARWPQKFGDYLAAGRVLMVNEVGEIVKYTRAHPAPFVVVEWNPPSIGQALEQMSNDRSAILLRGESSRKLADNDMSWMNRASELEDFYLKIIAP